MTQSFTFEASAATTGASGTRSYLSIRNTIVKYCSDDSAFFDDPTVNREINEALDRCSEETGAYKSSGSQTTVSGTVQYDTPDNIILIDEVTYDGHVLQKIDDRQRLRMYGSTAQASTLGTPCAYTVTVMGKIELYPTPSDAKTLVIHGSFYAPAYVDDGDTNVFPRVSDKYIINSAVDTLLRIDGETNRSPLYARDAKDDMDKLKRITTQKPVFSEMAFEDGV
jgi:hypothetical protein